MGSLRGSEQFWDDVLPAERREIERRKLAALGQDDLTSEDLETVGLALSGGGIRSATFSLGVLQGLAQHGVLRFVDYLSTVSGGGFIGSSLGSLLDAEPAPGTAGGSPFDRATGSHESAALVHLRNSSNYLAPGGLLDKLRLPTLFLRGALINLLLLLPWLMAAVQLTELAFEYHLIDSLRRWGPLSTAALFLGLVVLLPLFFRFFGDRLPWELRNLLELVLTESLLLTILVLLTLPFTLLVGTARQMSWEDLNYTLTSLLSSAGESPWKWVMIAAGALLLMLAAPASTSLGRARSKLLLYALGLLGPVIVFGLFFLLCVIQIDSPYLVASPELFRVDGPPSEESFATATTFGEIDYPDLADGLQRNGVSIDAGARVEALEPGVSWRVEDRVERRIFLLRKSGDSLTISEDIDSEVANGFFSPVLREQLAAKGVAIAAAELVEIDGGSGFVEHRYEIDAARLSAASVAALRQRDLTPELLAELGQALGVELGDTVSIEGHPDPPLLLDVTVRDDAGAVEFSSDPIEIPGEENRWTVLAGIVQDPGGEPYSVTHDEGRLVVANFEHQVWTDSSDPFFFSAWAIFLLFSLLIDVNQVSWHGFYRDRLSRSYLVQPSPLVARLGVEGLPELASGRLPAVWRRRLRHAGGLSLSRKARVHRGVDADSWLVVDRGKKYRLRSVASADGSSQLEIRRVLGFNDRQKLSELNPEHGRAPYHLINVALNLTGSDDADLRGRNADFFIFSKLFTGSSRTGYCPTSEMEKLDRHLNLGTAMAVSAAAASPNMGSTTVRSLVFIMAMLNIRLGYWLPSPRVALEGGKLSRMRAKFGVGAPYLFKEGLGLVDAKGPFVNLSDGGHAENLGVYELIRRRCKLILAVDGEEDAGMGFGSLIRLIRYASIDLGVDIQLDVGALARDPDPAGPSGSHWCLGTIHYGSYGGGEPGDVGYLLYIKATLTGDEREYVRAYARQNMRFPHESTADQFFSEDQFEAYRELGHHVGSKALAELGAKPGTIERMADLLALVRRAAEHPAPRGHTSEGQHE